MKKAIRYAAASAACLMLTGCASERSGGLVGFFKENYFEQTTTTQETTTAQTTTTQTTEQPEEIYDVLPGIDLDDSGSVVTIYSYNSDVETLLDGWTPLGCRVNFETLGYYNNSYYNELDNVLNTDSGDIDIFIVEAQYLPKYLSSEYSLPLELIGDVDTSEMYPSTINDCSQEDGLHAMAVTLNPGVFLYNRSVARAVLGTDDPDEVQSMISDWDKFYDTARRVKTAGYMMMPGFDDMLRAFGGEAMRFTDDSGDVVVSDAALDWAEGARMMYSSGLCGDAATWSNEWADSFTSRKCLGMFACNWLAEYTLPGYDDSGDWAVCKGPSAYTWGNDYALISTRSDNMTAAFKVLNRLCVECERSYPNGMAIPNNRSVLRSEYGNTELSSIGYQKPCEVYDSVLENVSTSVTGSGKDYDLSQMFMTEMKKYITGDVSFEAALSEFYNQAEDNPGIYVD